VAADRLAEDLAVERGHAFDVAGRDAEDLADGVMAPSGTQPRSFWTIFRASIDAARGSS
jgi:uncharacterized protein YqfA (UPF0365 family)